jgi:hypothetical protein
MVEKQAMNSVLCHLGNPRTAKPATLQEYGALRERMIMAPWVAVSEVDFVRAVTEQGCPFYGGLCNGRDLLELQFEKLVWRTQSLVGLDFDVCEVSADDMCKHFQYLGMQPWLVYPTFSNGTTPGRQSYRLVWRTQCDLNLTYDECSRALKKMRLLSNNFADKFALNPTRMFQGSNAGFFHYDTNAKRLNLKELSA